MQTFNSATSFLTFSNMRSSAYVFKPRPFQASISDPDIGVHSIFSEVVDNNGSSSGGNSDASETKRGK